MGPPVFGELRWRALSDYHTRGPFSFIPLIANAESIFGLGLTLSFSLATSIIAFATPNRPKWHISLVHNRASYWIALTVSVLSIPFACRRLIPFAAIPIAVFALLIPPLLRWCFDLSESFLFDAETFLVTVVGIYCRVWLIRTVSSTAQSDMLPLIKSAIIATMQGENPYHIYTMSHVSTLPPYELPLTYLPLQWLAYFPAVLLGLDLRYTNVFLEVTVFLLLVVTAIRRTHNTGDLPWGVLGAASLLFLNGYFILRIDAEVFVTTFIIAVTAGALVAGYIWEFWMLLGLALATSPLVLIFIPFVASYSYIQYRSRVTIIGLLMSFAVAVAIVSPFVLKDPGAFWSGTAGHWQEVRRYSGTWANAWMRNLNWSVLFYEYGYQRYLVACQMVGVFVSFAVYIALRGPANVTRTLAFCSMALFVFLQFDVISWTYLFHPVALLTCWVLLTVQDNRATLNRA